MHPLVKVLFVALSLGLDVFAVGIGVGMRDVSTTVKVRIGISFATAEVVMNVVGLLIGRAAGALLGSVAGYIGFLALIGVGIYMLFEAAKQSTQREAVDFSRGWGLVIASLSISLDSLGIGFSIVYIGVPVYFTLAVIFAVSIVATTSGLALGRTLGRRIEERAELFAGIVLIVTGLVFIGTKAFHIG